MTPQERAEAFVQAWMKQSTYTTESFINDVLEHDKETRRAALLEAAGILQKVYEESFDDWNGYVEEVIETLTRLAQEG